MIVSCWKCDVGFVGWIKCFNLNKTSIDCYIARINHMEIVDYFATGTKNERKKEIKGKQTASQWVFIVPVLNMQISYVLDENRVEIQNCMNEC